MNGRRNEASQHIANVKSGFATMLAQFEDRANRTTPGIVPSSVEAMAQEVLELAIRHNPFFHRWTQRQYPKTWALVATLSQLAAAVGLKLIDTGNRDLDFFRRLRHGAESSWTEWQAVLAQVKADPPFLEKWSGRLWGDDHEAIAQTPASPLFREAIWMFVPRISQPWEGDDYEPLAEPLTPSDPQFLRELRDVMATNLPRFTECKFVDLTSSSPESPVRKNISHIVDDGPQDELRTFYRKWARQAPRLCGMLYEAEPAGGNFIFPFMLAPVGEYGKKLAAALAITATYVTDLTDHLETASREIARTMPDMVARLARADDEDKAPELAPLRALREGVFTATGAIGLLTANRLAGFENPCNLVRAVVEQGLLVRVGRDFPAALIGPLQLTASYLPGIVQEVNGRLDLNPDIMDELSQLQGHNRAGDHLSPVATGYGCPFSSPSGQAPPQILVLGRIFAAAFEAIYPIVEKL